MNSTESFTDYITFTDIETLITSVLPNEKAQILAQKLKDKFIINFDRLYQFDKENVLYTRTDKDVEKYIYHITTLLMEHSFKALHSYERENLKLKYKNAVDKVFANSFIKSFFPQLTIYLTNDNINFHDPQINEIHFVNGYFDFLENKFKKRIPNKHFISITVCRDYKEPSQKSITTVKHILKKIYPKDDDLHYLLMTLGVAITGQSTINQTILFLLGLGSTGKSTIMKLLKACYGDYIYELPSDFFVKGNTKLDKIINTYKQLPFIRVSWLNEPIDTKMNDSLMKMFCEGLLQATALYKDGCENFNHYSKLIITANTMPNFKLDTGTARRVDSYTHKSLFTNDPTLVNEEKHTYLTDPNLITEFIEDEDKLNALFKILADYAYGWITKKQIYQQTKNFKDTKNEVISSNDKIGDFIDRSLILTNDTTHRIGKEQMYEKYKHYYPKDLISQIQLINALKDKQIAYSCDMRCEKVKGCFYGVKFNDDTKCFIQVEEPKYTDEYVESLLMKIKELEKQLEDYKRGITAEIEEEEDETRENEDDEEDELIYEDSEDLMEALL